MAKRTFTAGATSQTIDVFIQDTTKTDGSGLAGLVFNSSGLKCYYRKGALGTATAVTLATQTVGGAWSSGGFVEIDATNMKGAYRFDVPDTVLASAPYAVLHFYGATNMAQTYAELEILAAAPLTTSDIPSSNISAIKAKTDSLTFTVAGQVDANIQYVNDVLVNGIGSAGNPWGP